MREHPAAPQLYAGLAAVRASLPSSPQSQTTPPPQRPAIAAATTGAALISPPNTPRQHPIRPSIHAAYAGPQPLLTKTHTSQPLPQRMTGTSLCGRRPKKYDGRRHQRLTADVQAPPTTRGLCGEIKRPQLRSRASPCVGPRRRTANAR